MNTPIQLIVGLGNPGKEYQSTRHNAGAWFVEAVAESEQLTLKYENKYKSYSAVLTIAEQETRLLIPDTYMNHSGQAVVALTRFYKIPPEAILVAHDDLDLAPGIARLKLDGGHGGHNGLRDIIAHLNTAKFYRLRIGIGHPGHSDAVIGYVLGKPAREEKLLIDSAIKNTLPLLPDLAIGRIQHAMKTLHTKISS